MVTAEGCVLGASSDPQGLLDPYWLGELLAPRCLGYGALLGLLPSKSLPLKIGASLELLKEANAAPWLMAFLDNGNRRIIKSGTPGISGA